MFMQLCGNLVIGVQQNWYNLFWL